MEKVRILAIAPYPEMADIMSKVAAKNDKYLVNIQVGNINTCVKVIGQIPAGSYDIIVSRGGTARRLRALVKVPVVEISVSVYEALRSLRMAENYKGKFAVVGFQNITECVSQLSALLQYKLDIFTYESAEDIGRVLNNLHSQNYEMILCDTVCAQMARQLGLNVMLITSDEHSIETAFDQAYHIAQANSQTLLQNQLLRAIINNCRDDYVIVSKEGNVIYSSVLGSKYEMPIFSVIEALGSRIWCSNQFCHGCIIEGQYIYLDVSRLLFDSEEVCCIKISYADYLPYIENKGVMLLNSHEMSEQNVTTEGSFFFGTSKQVIEKYAKTAYPILLIGEKGSGKGETCLLLHRHGPFSQSPMAIIDCKMTTSRQWRFLLNSEHSPFMSTNITICISNLQCLSQSNAQELFELMYHTNLCHRNRIIFSQITQAQDADTSYIQDYIEGHFSTITLRLPALREYREQIPNIAILYLNQLNISLGKSLIGFDPKALELLQNYPWPGNLSQLYRIIRSLTVAADAPFISGMEVANILFEERNKFVMPASSELDLNRPLNEINYDIIMQVLSQNNNNQRKTAEILGISRSTLWRILKSYSGYNRDFKKEDDRD